MQRADSIRMLTQLTNERMMNHESNHQSRSARHVQKSDTCQTPPMTKKPPPLAWCLLDGRDAISSEVAILYCISVSSPFDTISIRECIQNVPTFCAHCHDPPPSTENKQRRLLQCSHEMQIDAIVVPQSL
jgi:hypothetical protein